VGSSQSQIQVAYDVDNDFFRLWLDEQMSYSCALYLSEGDSLETAQRQKHEHHFMQARCTTDTRVLDIGCGWGANVEHLVRARGVRDVHCITLSPAQHAEVVARRLPGVTAHLGDFMKLETTARFDAVISIGMIEHLVSPDEYRAGQHREVYRRFFDRVWELTTPGARVSMQGILRLEVPRNREHLRDLGWISTIFPGGLTLTLDDVVTSGTRRFELEALHTRREHYGRTCRDWRGRLRAHEAVIRARWGDALFETYDRYLGISVTVFEESYGSLAQWTLRRRP
jgi:cyclopropane-fatty-acyl-phospholipid synthase